MKRWLLGLTVVALILGALFLGNSPAQAKVDCFTFENAHVSYTPDGYGRCPTPGGEGCMLCFETIVVKG